MAIKSTQPMSPSELIRTRRSIRKFTAVSVDQDQIQAILQAAQFAPSGLNNQPWRFAVITEQAIKDRIAPLTHYSSIIRDATLLIAVFLDNESSYDRTKDVQGIGACIQNMLLAAHGLGLGGVWLGEILKNAAELAELVEAPEEFELMAVLALGYPAEIPRTPARKSLDELVFFKK